MGLQISNTVNTNNASNFKAYLRNAVLQSIFLEPHEPNEILNIIRSLNIHKASGSGGFRGGMRGMHPPPPA